MVPFKMLGNKDQKTRVKENHFQDKNLRCGEKWLEKRKKSEDR